MIAPDPVFKNAVCATLPESEKRVFFARDGANREHRKAKAYCAECPLSGVDGPCLKRALEFEKPDPEYPDRVFRYGVWGGFTARERERMFGGGVARDLPA